MAVRRPFARDQRATVVYGMLAFVIIVVLLQLWLLAATMNAFLGGDDAVVWPAALASLSCFALNAGLLWFLGRMEQPLQYHFDSDSGGAGTDPSDMG